MKGLKATEAFYQSPQKHRDESMKANRRKLELEELNSGNIECEWLWSAWISRQLSTQRQQKRFDSDAPLQHDSWRHATPCHAPISSQTRNMLQYNVEAYYLNIVYACLRLQRALFKYIASYLHSIIIAWINLPILHHTLDLLKRRRSKSLRDNRKPEEATSRARMLMLAQYITLSKQAGSFKTKPLSVGSNRLTMFR